MSETIKIAIIGGGPSGMFMLKRLLEIPGSKAEVSVFERSGIFGAGMPYGPAGANEEHMTNISAISTPTLVTTITEWIRKAAPEKLSYYGVDLARFTEHTVLPRLLFGEYLSDQFTLLQKKARERGTTVSVNSDTKVNDIFQNADTGKIDIYWNETNVSCFDTVVICTGHFWPKGNETLKGGYFDSPYPPSKLKFTVNEPVAVRGASLTAMDCVTTLARNHGTFFENEDGLLSYRLNAENPNFRIVLHSRRGILPVVEFYLENPLPGEDQLLGMEEVEHVREKHEGFVPLDYVFDKVFVATMEEKQPELLYESKGTRMEEFVAMILDRRERIDPFALLKMEYEGAKRSIATRSPIPWKETLATLSFAMNYPAKYFSAEDSLRLQKVLMPLIAVAIAVLPRSLARELLALHDAGVVELVEVGDHSAVEMKPTGGILYHYVTETDEKVTVDYKWFVDCIGQRHLYLKDWQFPSLQDQGVISAAKLKFRSSKVGKKELEDGNKAVYENGGSGDFYLRVPGLTINDHFQVGDADGRFNDQVYIMAVPFIGGVNPDYSGLDFCEAASKKIASRITQMWGLDITSPARSSPRE